MNTTNKISTTSLRQLAAIRTLLRKPVEIKLLSDRMDELDREFAKQTKTLAAVTKNFAKKFTKQ